MTHKRSRRGRKRAEASYLKRLQRKQHEFDLQTLYFNESGYFNERGFIWGSAFFDDELDEVVNTVVCFDHPIHRGEVLSDSRNRGYFQRLT